MGSITSALLSAGNAMSVFERSFDVIENNITNANTPGYAEQVQSLEPLPFDPSQGLAGGVTPGPLLNTRSEYAEQSVREQDTALGNAQQRSNDLGQVQPLFDLTSTTGISSSLNNFFNSLSQLTVNPNDEVSRQAVITQAAQLAQNFNQSSTGIAQVATNAATATTDVVTQINQLATQIASINQTFQSSSQSQQDESLDTDLHNDLESLSTIANISIIRVGDGAYNVYLGGQTPLVLGDTTAPVSVGNSAGATTILDASGNDITAHINSGQLGALIGELNVMLPGYQASLNTLAQSLADTVNTTLAGGVDINGNAPTTDLFSYNASSAAASIAVTGITPDQIAAASAASPGGNGNAIALSQLSTAADTQGFTFTQYYGNLGATVGSDVSSAQQDHTQAQDQLTQAQLQRTAISGVDLNEEATKLLQYQQAYQAVGQLVSVIGTLTTALMNMFNPTVA
jgi:flagellar hook-associated protein 1 FlgK